MLGPGGGGGGGGGGGEGVVACVGKFLTQMHTSSFFSLSKRPDGLHREEHDGFWLGLIKSGHLGFKSLNLTRVWPGSRFVGSGQFR